jgi:hypothetical protein
MDIEAEIERRFSALPKQGPCNNPVTGDGFMMGMDPIKPQKQEARIALQARAWFCEHGPADCQPLPLSYNEREDLKHGGVLHILAWYARSVRCLHYRIEEHPSFEEYARGVMASDVTLYFVKNDEDLLRRFPPRLLEGLDGGLIWEPPAKKARKVTGQKRRRATYRCALPRAA